jgi:3-oxoacyl-[acyl-carrier protein] reductase
MDLGLAGRAAVVGGGSSGLGLAVAEALAAEGCRLLIWARNDRALQEAATRIRDAHGAEVHVLAADAAQPDAAGMVADAAVEALGRVDVLLLNAGGPPTTDPSQTDADEWRRVLQLLALTPIELATRLLPDMRERRWGRVVAILSYGIRQPIRELAYSNSGRLALAAWMKTTAGAVAADGVTMNGVMPGRIDTARVRALDDQKAEREGRSVEDVKAEYLRTIPMGRYGEPRDLAALVAFLASEPAGYITGQLVAADGGLISAL